MSGRLIADVRPSPFGCSGLLAVDRINGKRRRGRTELRFASCADPLLQGWQLQLSGQLRRPVRGSHALLPAAAERLARHGSWSQLRVEQFAVLGPPWTPLADIRRAIAVRLRQTAGDERGGLLAALVLGSAQVPLPNDLRQSFRVAGLSHALAASGFHLSVLLGSALALSRRWRSAYRLGFAAGALLLFLCLAGAQPSVVRAVVMGAAALLIRESGDRGKPFGLLLLSLSGMLLMHPAWAGSIGFQLSAAATAGLILTAPRLEEAFRSWFPVRCQFLAPALAIPIAAMAWTLPLQLLHFGSTPLYAVLANVLVAPLLAPLTLSAMVSALLSLLLPAGWLLGVLWPVQQLAGLLIALVSWISHWPGAQLLTGHPQTWVVLLFALGLLPWLLKGSGRMRGFAVLPLLAAVTTQVTVQLGHGVVAVERFRTFWLLARFGGRAALITTKGDQHSCNLAGRLARGHGHTRLDWVMVLDPVATEAISCWSSLARHVQAPHQGRPPLEAGQRLASDGLSVERPKDRRRPLILQVGRQRWQLLVHPQELMTLQRDPQLVHSRSVVGTWLGFSPTKRQRRWLQNHPSGRRLAGD